MVYPSTGSLSDSQIEIIDKFFIDASKEFSVLDGLPQLIGSQFLRIPWGYEVKGNPIPYVRPI